MRYASTRLGNWSWLPYATILFAFLGMLGGGYWVWQQYEFSRAFRELKAGDYESVIPRTERLIAFGPDKDRARVIQVRALIELDLEGAREELDELMSKGGAREHPEVGLAYLRLRLDSKDLEGIDKNLQDWQASLADNPDFLLIQAKIRLEQKETTAAFNSLEQLLALDPKNEEALLMRGKILLTGNNRAQAIQAKANLRAASKAWGDTGYDALVTLATHPAIPLFDNDREWLMERLRQNRKQTPLSRLLADSQQLILEPAKRQEIIAAAINREGPQDPELVAQWLMANGAYEQLKAFLQSNAASGLDGKGRWGAQMRASLLSGDFDGAMRLLNESDQPVDAVRRATLLAFIELGQQAAPSPTPTDQWKAAYEMAMDARAAHELFSLGQLAMRMKWEDAAVSAFAAAIEFTDNDREKVAWIPYQLANFTMQGKTQEMLKLVRRSLELNPDDIAMLNNLYYLEALTDAAPGADPHRILPLVQKVPNSIMHSTYAFLLWKDSQLDAAYEQFRLLDSKYYTVPSVRLGGGLILVDRGDYVGAEKLMKPINPEQLMPEERTLFQQAETKLAQHREL